jgi:hypothetical protein
MSDPWLSRGLPLLIALGLNGCAKKPGPAEAARHFFELIQAGKAAEAYDSATFLFREQQTLSYFQTVLHQLGLDTVQAANYKSPEFRDERRAASVEAEFTTKKSVPVPLVISLAEQDGQWRVLSLKSPRNRQTNAVENRFTLIGTYPAFIDPTEDHAPPSPTVARKMVHESLLAFNDAVQRKSFEDLFDQCAMRWQDQLARPDRPQTMPGRKREPLTPKERELGASRLQHAFQAFVQEGINIGGIANVEAVLDRDPWVNTDGLLVVSGYYPTKPFRVLFSLRYWYELPMWRLFGMDVKFTKDDQAAP